MENNQSEVTFYETTHRYILNKTGKELIAVSRILELAGVISFEKVPFEIRERAAFMGDCIHETARLYAKNQLDVESLDEILKGHYESIKKFHIDRVKKLLFVEQIVFDSKLGYAGTVDIVYQDQDNHVCLDDFKSGLILPAVKLQTALYKNAFEKNYAIKVDERASVYLNGGGTYKREVYRDKQDFHDAMNCVGVAFWKLKNKVK